MPCLRGSGKGRYVDQLGVGIGEARGEDPTAPKTAIRGTRHTPIGDFLFSLSIHKTTNMYFSMNASEYRKLHT